MRQLYLFTALWAGCALAQAQQAPRPEPASPITDQFAFRAGIFYGTVSTNGRVDAPLATTAGTPFSLEQDFHLSPRVHEARAEVMFRLNERGRLRVDLWEILRGGVTNPTTTFVYGNHTFTPTDRVYSQFNWRQLDITWTYSLLRSKRFELGAGMGLHLIEAEADANVPAAAPTPIQQTFTGAGPFITVAVDGTWLMSRRWSCNARAQYLKLTVGAVKGSLGDYHADVQFRWRPNLAFGLGYASTLTQLNVNSGNPHGLMRLATHGPELFLRASF